jgi:hypothetical protein
MTTSERLLLGLRRGVLGLSTRVEDLLASVAGCLARLAGTEKRPVVRDHCRDARR